jgi:two-component system, chemotaxis family, chemotaxis protein CheY
MTQANGKRILIVDDAALIRTYYRAALEVQGFEIEEALNGLEGLEKVLSDSFDLVIVDVNMPRMDGITFLRALRAKELPTSSVPVLVTSTESGPQDMAAARSAGANYYLVKPIRQDMLAEYAAIFCGVLR